ncbi:hypothetical protein D3C77_583020 [compost metagenome]
MRRVVRIQVMLAGVNVLILDNYTFAQLDAMLQCLQPFAISDRYFVQGMEGKAQTDADLQLQVTVYFLLKHLG